MVSRFWPAIPASAGREMENVVETSLNTALIQVLPDGNILLNGGPVSVAELEPKLVAWRASVRPPMSVPGL